MSEKEPQDEAEKILKLKRSRAGYKSVLTKKHNDIDLLLLDYKNLDAVVTEQNELSEAWHKFSKAHRLVVECLSENEEAMQEASTYYEDAQTDMITFDRKVVSWLDEARDKLSQQVKAEDSASQASSNRSTSSSAIRLKKANEKANLCAAEIRLKMIEEECQLEERKRQLRRQHEEEEYELERQGKIMKARAELEAAKAREAVFTAVADEASSTSSVRKKIPKTQQNLPKKRSDVLDPNATEWVNKHYHVQPPSQKQYSPEGYMSEVAAAFFLPKPEVPIFKGDPLEYCSFVMAFKNLIEDKTSNASARLHYLVQYTSGDVQELMRSCLPMEPAEGYTEAQRLLKVKYGQNYRIASAYVEKITTGPTIKSEDRDSLQKLSVLMISCKNVLNNIGYISKIENPDAYRSIIARLPYDLRKKWRTKADHISEDQCKEITFNDIVYFIEREARMASHPIFGDLSSPKDNIDKRRNDIRQRRTSFATVSSAQPHSPSLQSHTSGVQSRAPTVQSHAHNIQSHAPNIQSHAPNVQSHAHNIQSHAPNVQSHAPNMQSHALSNMSNVKKEESNNIARKCSLCSLNHKIEDCIEFKKLDIDGRANIAFKLGLCYNCLIPKHRVIDCRKRPMCIHCSKKHASMLHRNNCENMGSNSSKEAHVGAAVSKASQCIGLPIVQVKVKGQNGEFVATNAFLDGGSNMTFCSQELINQLGITGKKTSVLLTTLDKEKGPVEGELFNLQLMDMAENNDFVELSSVMCRPILPITDSDIPKQCDIDRWPHLQGIRVHNETCPVGLLIGNDNAEILQPLDVIPTENGGPYAVKTMFGWTVNGPLGRPDQLKNCTVNFVKGDSTLSQQFKEFCDREFQDSLADSSMTMSRNDTKAIKIMDDSVKLKDSHYEMDLPLKGDSAHLPDNKILAERRLDLLRKRLVKDENMKVKYVTFMKNLFQKGYAEVIPDDDLSSEEGMTWYLPHHAVTNPNKPEKVRVVFDCSAKFKNLSLNDRLFQGPDLNNSLLGVLLRFRKFPVAMISDVESMYYQVFVSPHHRDLLRFLWWKDGNLDDQTEVCRMKVHIFGATSSPSCCAYALKKTANDNRHVIDDITLNTVLNNFYVDDCLVSTEDEESAIQLREQLSCVLAKGGFHLAKWASNSTAVLESIPEDERAIGVKSIDISRLCDAPEERTLGVRWNIYTDQFTFDRIDATIKMKPTTRRGILSTMSSVYDPLGFISPVVLSVKKLLQNLCRLKIDWDSCIPDQYVQQWNEWLSQLPLLSRFSVARCLQPGMKDTVSMELHHFSDASEDGYGCVSYLRVEDSSGEVKLSFIMSKSRVAPLKTISIPRLELAAATLSVRLDSVIRKELNFPITRSIFWTDSTAVLKYIFNEDRRFHTYVANRIAVIRDGSDKSAWRYVESRFNPADDASRGLSVNDLINKPRWLMGPCFLIQPESQWPALTDKLEPIVLDDPEVKKSYAVVVTADANRSVTDDLLERYSSWFKLLRCVAWILRYKRKLLAAVQVRKLGNPSVPKKMDTIQSITVSELSRAEHEIVKLVQRNYYADEISALSGTQMKRVKKSSSLYKLNPVFDDDVLRLGGRLSYSELNKYQYILPKNHHVSHLIIRHYHAVSGHSGREYVLSLLRKKFWIIHGNTAVRSVLSKCIECRKIQGRVGEQRMADLPRDRLNVTKPPFSSTGVDFFGHFLVKRGRAQVKRYALLFTCLATRAVHIEVTHGLDTTSFLNAINRFIARRGKPETIRSDNGGSFVRGEKEIREGIAAWNQSHIHTHLLQRGIDWIFNPPLGSHHGGIWERCIRTARKILKSLLRQQVVDDDGLHTLMCEVESIINSRPITKVSDDHNDIEALTPNHLLMFQAGEAKLPMGIFYKDDQYQRRWRHIQYLADVFWRRWVKEYLPLQQERHKWNYPSRNFRIGDIVLLVDTTVPRNAWPLGRVVQVYPGRDKLVRRVQVRAKSGLYERPIDKLILLDGICD